MKFDIPFFNNKEYVRFINENRSNIYSLYYRLPIVNHAFDARNAKKNDLYAYKEFQLIEKTPAKIKKYGLLNSKIIFSDFYKDTNIDNVIEIIFALFNKNLLNGILITDFMYLQKLRERMSNDLASKIEIVPSVNVKLQNVSQISYTLGHIKKMGFKLPAKIILDRSLNRNPKKINEIRIWQQINYPDMMIEILVNEGCLPYCPYKDSHDVFISIFNQRNESKVLKLFRKNACKNIFINQWHYLTSPFIRPEDIEHLSNNVDILKIAGRTYNNEFIINTFNAYQNRKWEGNLFQLLEVMFAIK